MSAYLGHRDHMWSRMAWHGMAWRHMVQHGAPGVPRNRTRPWAALHEEHETSQKLSDAAAPSRYKTGSAHSWRLAGGLQTV